uniref:ribonuclease H n=1 Tax=Dicentrarchus labrax TaxID=13489 RepID=A0A8C4NSX5_DICLA
MPSPKTPRGDSQPLRLRRSLSASPDVAVTIRSAMLRRRSPGNSPGGPDGKRPKVTEGIRTLRRVLFPRAPRTKPSMILMSWVKSWRSQMVARRRLPPFVWVGLRIPWLAWKCPLCDTNLATAKEAVNHLSRVHYPKRILYLCRKCAGGYSSLARVTRHTPKCGTKLFATQLGASFTCSHCPGTFGSQRGLSNHKRAKHTMAYMSEVRTSANIGTVWTPDEEVCLEELRKEKGGKPGFYAAAVERLPKFSKAQIRSKCRSLAKAACFAKAKTFHSNTSQGVKDFKHLRSVLPVVADVELVKENWTNVLAGMKTVRGGLSPQDDNSKNTSRYVKRISKQMRGDTAPIPLNRPSSGSAKRLLRVHTLKKRFQYKILQSLYSRNRADAAKLILDGKAKTTCRVDVKQVERTYREVWGGTDGFVSLGQFGNLPQVDNGLFFGLITSDEALSAVKRIAVCSAPGPDKVRRGDLLRWDPKGSKLASLFNTMLYSGKIPMCLKVGRTTLIPKTSDEAKLANIGQWRPITIGSVILRAFSGVINKRLAGTCPIHVRQRGFIESSGCSENLSILEGVIRMSKSQKRSLAVVFIDIAKAFDSVSHRHILEVLQRRGLDVAIRRLIASMYDGSSTTIRTEGGTTGRIRLTRGVKQGDPLSPLLFNLAIDPLLRTLEKEGEGFHIGAESVMSLAFADDLVLLSGSWAGMTTNLRILEEFCSLTGLRANPQKCHGFMIDAGRRSYKVNECDSWVLWDTPIPMIGVDSSERYLGVQINPWKGIVQPKLREILRDLTGKIGKAKLKPSQKLEVLRSYALPRVIYLADHGMVNHSVLYECDRDIRVAVKQWLHLDTSTADGLLYSSFNDGGLGVLKLSAHIPTVQLRRLVRLHKSSDELTSTVARAVVPSKVLRGLWNRTRKNCGGECADPKKVFLVEDVNLKSLTTKEWREAEFARWCGLKSQGAGTMVFMGDQVSNHWLRNPRACRLQESEFIFALKLRTTTISTLSTLRRGRVAAAGDLVCRLCGKEKETLRHIIGRCSIIQRKRMQNHNKICDILQSVGTEAGWSVMREKRLITASGQVGVPDLIMSKGSTALIIDVAVPFEATQTTLKKMEQLKVAKYLNFVGQVKEGITGISTVSVHGFPVGARGKWYEPNNTVLAMLGVPEAKIKRLSILFSRRALLLTIDLCKLFRNLTR